MNRSTYPSRAIGDKLSSQVFRKSSRFSVYGSVLFCAYFNSLLSWCYYLVGFVTLGTNLVCWICPQSIEGSFVLCGGESWGLAFFVSYLS